MVNIFNLDQFMMLRIPTLFIEILDEHCFEVLYLDETDCKCFPPSNICMINGSLLFEASKSDTVSSLSRVFAL